jgi:hypothetical protein
MMRIWDTSSDEYLQTLEGQRFVYSVAFSHDSIWLALDVER